MENAGQIIHARKQLRKALPGILKSFFYSVSLLVGVVTASFLLFQVLPGDVARIRLGISASEEAVARLRRELGLDKPLTERFSSHLGGLLRGDLGTSYFDGRDVTTQVASKFATTARIGIAGALIALVVSYLVNAATFFWGRTAVLIQLVKAGVVFPVFFTTVLGALLTANFFPQLGFFGDSSARYILPAIVVSLYPTAVMTTVLREWVVSAMTSQNFRAAKAFGLSGFPLFHRTVFRPCLVPWLAAWINQLSVIVFSALVVEVILSVPGLGGLLLDSILRRDFPMIQGILLVNACSFIFLYWLSEIMYPWLDARMR